MISPFTGGKITEKREESELIFRKESFKYVKHYYLCNDTNEQFTTTELDELNIVQIYNQYRVKYGIPFPDEIKEIRNRYKLSATMMSKILGFGDNQYRLYENGDIPSESNGKILNSIKQPIIFKAFVDNAQNQLSPKEYEDISIKLKKIIESPQENFKEKLIFEGYSRNITNGYALQSIQKLRNIILYFIAKCDGIFNTKMNKLLFYTDFLSYKKSGFGMSGLAYKAIKYGPVPIKWNRVYSLIDDIHEEIIEFNSGITGTKLCSEVNPDMTIFSNTEIEILNLIATKFTNLTAADLSKLSHNEDAWQLYFDNSKIINYNEAFKLRAL